MQKFTRAKSGRVYGIGIKDGNPVLRIFLPASGNSNPPVAQLKMDGFGAPELSDFEVMDVLVLAGLPNLTTDKDASGHDVPRVLGKLDRLEQDPHNTDLGPTS